MIRLKCEFSDSHPAFSRRYHWKTMRKMENVLSFTCQSVNLNVYVDRVEGMEFQCGVRAKPD